MSFVDPDASGIKLYEDLELGSFTSMPSAWLSEPGQLLADYSVAAVETAILSDGQGGGHIPGGGDAELLGNHYFFTDTHMYVAKSEQGEDSTDDFVNIFEDLDDTILWQPEQLLACHEDDPFMYDASHCQAHESIRVANENCHRYGIFDVDASVNNPEIDAVLSGVRRSARAWPSYVRLVCACHRLRSKIDTVEGEAKKKNNRKRKKRVECSKRGYPCEIRISKKLIPKDGEYLKGKAWLGTFATPDQRGRALDVGKYFLSAKEKKTFYDPNSEAILSTVKGRLHELPLTERVGKVIKLAKYYGENGLVPENLNSL